MTYRELFKNSKFLWLIVSLLVITPFEILSFFSIHFPLLIELPLFILIILVFGKKVFASGIRSLAKLDFSNINVLMTVATSGAIYLQEFEEAAIIIVLFSLGDTLEEFGIERSQRALKDLVEKVPKSAQLKGKEEKIPIEAIKVGAIVVIKPGDQIPLDGKVIEGRSLVDEAAITGEPLPRNKYIGDSVYAGTINGQGYLEVKVTKEAKDTTLAKIIELTYKSSEKKAVSQKFIEIFAKFYTPSVICASLLLVIIPVVFWGKSFNVWFTQALTLLIISCPCALVISTPIAVFSAIGNATQKGALIKGGRFLEEMGKVKAIAFDKTKTLTKGEPVVTDIIPFNGFTQEDVSACVAGLETFSEHPISKSIRSKADELGVEVHGYTNFLSMPGKGLSGECTVCFDKHHCVGNIRFVTEEHHVEEEVLKTVEELERQGKTAIVTSDNKRVKGIISIADEIRSESKKMVETLHQLNIFTIILTGDNKSSAEYVAKELGIPVAKADLLPEEKMNALSKIIQQYQYVAMVGDGVNDAPALATASVGIAMGAVGSDVAIENADIALMNDNLILVPYLVELGRECVKKIRFNITSAVLIKFIFLSLAILGLSNLALAIFADVGVTILVILNSLRLYSYKHEHVA